MAKDADHPHVEKHIVAYAEKRQNMSSGQNGEKYLVATTRLDPLTYILFGAYRISVTQRGLECDEWLPVIGRMDVLDDLERLKVMVEDCMLRVFQGIIASRQRKAQSNKKPLTYDGGREDESGDEEDDDEENIPPPAFTVKLIDFAHTRVEAGLGPDEGVLLGIDTVLRLLDGRIQQLVSEKTL